MRECVGARADVRVHLEGTINICFCGSRSPATAHSSTVCCCFVVVLFCFLFHSCNYSRRYQMKPHTELIPGRTWKQRFQGETEDS